MYLGKVFKMHKYVFELVAGLANSIDSLGSTFTVNFQLKYLIGFEEL